MDKSLAGKNQAAKTSQKKPSPSVPAAQKPAVLPASEIAPLAPPGHRQVLHLQSLVGNRAVQRLLPPPARLPAGAGAPLQRWGGDEHYDIGKAAGMQIDLGNGVVLEWGEVIGLGGDEVASPEELMAWVQTETGKARLRAALEHAEVAGNGVKTLPAPDDDQKKEQRLHFHMLLLDNINHFQSGGAALDTWRSYHAKALNLALAAGIAHPTESSKEINPAYLQEAFGQHFLTDMFSSGHAITPRSEINDYYVNTWAPKTVDFLLANLRARLVDGIYAQVARQSVTAEMIPGPYRSRIGSAIDEEINKNIGKLKGGKAELTTLLGKGVAGLISGAIHDSYNVKGVKVSSVYHPEPWLALGDSHLNDAADATNKQQAELAVKAGLEEVQLAYEIGQREGAFKKNIPQPLTLPERVYFKFNSDAVESQAQDALEKAAAYLAYHPDVHLYLTGYTDPIGADVFNEGLGQRRADSVAGKIMDHAIAAAQITTHSQGEKDLVTTNPRKYALNRRVLFTWSAQSTTQPDTTDESAIALERAAEALKALVGPPYQNVEGFLPQVVAGANTPVPDWHWESLSPAIWEMIDVWVRRRFDQALKDELLASDLLQKRTIQGFEVDPREIVEEFLKEIDASPIAFLYGLFQDPNGPPTMILGNGVNLVMPP